MDDVVGQKGRESTQGLINKPEGSFTAQETYTLSLDLHVANIICSISEIFQVKHRRWDACDYYREEPASSMLEGIPRQPNFSPQTNATQKTQTFPPFPHKFKLFSFVQLNTA